MSSPFHIVRWTRINTLTNRSWWEYRCFTFVLFLGCCSVHANILCFYFEGDTTLLSSLTQMSENCFDAPFSARDAHVLLWTNKIREQFWLEQMANHKRVRGGHCRSWHHHEPMAWGGCGGWAAGLANDAAEWESGREDAFRLRDLARKLAPMCGSGVSCFTGERAWCRAKMATHEGLVSVLIESRGAGLKLHHSWSGGFPPLKLFFAESSFAEIHRGTSLLFSFLLFLT